MAPWTKLSAKPLLAVAAALLAGSAAPAAGVEASSSRWREAFQSSPATYTPFTPEFEKLITEKFKLPPQIMGQMRPKEATGTIRVRLAVSAGGSQLRIRLSNEEGKTPLTLTSASVGAAGAGFGAQPGTLKALTFDGKRGTVIPAGAPMLSDPIELDVTPGAELLVSATISGNLLFMPQGGALMAVGAGEQTLRDGIEGATYLAGRPLVSGVEVLAPRPPRVVVTLGDSITDGNRAKQGELRGWPEELARRLAARKTGRTYAVVNAGIGGNRVLASGWGLSALARLDRDVLRIEGVSHLVVLEGTNDIGQSGASIMGNNPEITAGDLIAGYQQIVARAHARGIKVILGTILPFEGSFTHFTPAKEKIRLAVNAWIREAKEADGIIDFEQIARDPARPSFMRKDFGSPDGLHPGEAGYRIMGDAIDLSLFD